VGNFYAQEHTINGSIINENNEAVAFANIILITKDQVIYKGTSSDENGNFYIENIDTARYTLQVSFLGFEEYNKEIEIMSDISLGKITLIETSESLNEIEIIAKRPVLKKQQDRLVFTVTNTSLTEGNVWEVLKGTPGILMINDEITVKNSSNIIYLINNRRVYLDGNELQQLLNGTSASSVKSIEVITNPPAKYDASGGAVINIVMSKNLITGYNGSIYSNYTQGIYPRANAGTSHFFKNDKWNVFVGYAFDYSKINRENIEDVTFIENSVEVGKWHSEIDRNKKARTHTVNSNVDYNFNENNTLSFSSNITLTPSWKRKTKSITQAIDSTFTSINNTRRENNNIALNLGYENIGNKGNVFTTNFHFTSYNFDGLQELDTEYFNNSNNFIRSNLFTSTSIQEVSIFSGQADYVFNIKEKETLEFGTKIATIDTDNNFIQTNLNNGSEMLDLNNSGIFKYRETIFAPYLSYTKSWEKWNLSLGLRSEYTDAEGNLVGVEVNKFDYFKFFPTLNLSHNFNEKHSLGISYSKRIQRPTYSSLNPFQLYLNDNTYLVGNPNLQPTISQLITLSYTLAQDYTFEVYYRHEENTMSELTFQDNQDNKIKYVASNLKEEVDYGFDFLTYKNLTKYWSIYLVNSIFKVESQFFAIENNNEILENSRWSMYSNLINYFKVDETTNAELSLLYISPLADGSSIMSTRAQVDFSIKKSIAKNKWVLSFTASDIFRTTGFEVRNNYLDQKNKYQAEFDNQWLRFGLRYNFGNTKLKTNQKDNSQIERERIKERD
jgi:hypothetical protein